MEVITAFVAKLAVWASLLLPTTLLVTVVTCAGAATLTLVLTWGVLRRERWASLLGLWFIVLTLQYLPPTLESWKVAWALDQFPTFIGAVQSASAWAHPVLSPLNNLVMFGAAALLLRWTGHEALIKLFSRWDRLRWVGLLPWWVWVLTILGLAAQAHRELDESWRRLPDALLSAVALAALAHAIYLNTVANRMDFLRKLFLWGLRTYALINLAFAFSPWVAQGIAWPALRKEFNQDVQAWIQARPDLAPLLGETSGDQPGRLPNTSASLLRGLDAGARGLALFFKLVLLGGIVNLMRRSLIALSPHETPQRRRNALSESPVLLSDQGIVRDLGERMSADLVDLYSTVPGDQPDQIRAATWHWLKSKEDRDREKRSSQDTVRPMGPKHESVVTRILLGGDEEMSRDLQRDEKYHGRFFDYLGNAQSFVSLPIKYHGATVGCLNVEWRNRQAFSETMLIELRETAELLAPIVQAQRELAAVHALFGVLRALSSRQDALNSATLATILQELLRFLSPAGVGICADYGFRRVLVVQACRSGTPPKVLAADTNQKRFSDELAKHLQSVGHRDVRSFREPLMDGETATGWLEFAAEGRKKPAQGSGMVSNELLRKTIAVLVSDTLRRIGRRELNGAVTELLQSLERTEGLGQTSLVAAVDIATKAVGIEGCLLHDETASSDDGRPAGPISELVSLYRRNPNAFEDVNFAKGGALSGVFRPKNLPSSSTLLRVDLRQGANHLWLQITRPGFGAEVSQQDTPWWQFLDDLGSAVGSALIRIEREKLRYEAEEQRLMALRVAMGGFAIHDVGNLASKLGAGLQEVRVSKTLEQARLRAETLGGLTRQIAQSAARLREPLEMAESRELWLPAGFEELKRKHEAGLAADGITLSLEAAPRLSLKVANSALHLVLDNLIANARREILFSRESGRTGGRIEVRVRDARKFVELDVIDDGPGVPKEKRATLFDFGHRGWGLPIARWVLQLHKGELILAEGSRPGFTRFSLKIPRL